MCLLLALGMLAVQATAAEPPAWILGRPDPDKGESVQAWLAIPADTTGRDSLTIRLAVPDGVRVGFGTCAGPSGPDAGEWRGLAAADTLLPVCVRSERRFTSRLVAVVRRAPLVTGDGAATTVIASEPLAVRPPWYWPPGPLAIAIIAALLGFAGGLITQIATGRLKARQDEQAKARAAKAEVIQHLLPELRRNRSAIEAFLDGNVVKPPDLEAFGFDKVFGANGAALVLTGQEQTRWLGEIQDLYTKTFSEYRRTVNQAQALDRIRAQAKRVREALLPYTVI